MCMCTDVPLLRHILLCYLLLIIFGDHSNSVNNVYGLVVSLAPLERLCDVSFSFFEVNEEKKDDTDHWINTCGMEYQIS